MWTMLFLGQEFSTPPRIPILPVSTRIDRDALSLSEGGPAWFRVGAVEPAMMTILHTVQPSRVIVAISGDLDMTVANSLREALDRLIDRYPVRDLVLDLSDVGFIDSSGLGVLLGRYRRLKPRDRTLLLVGVKPPVKAVLAVAGLGQIIPISDAPERLRDGHA